MNFTANFAFDNLSDSARQGIRKAIVSRGMRAGLLKKSPPASHTLGYPAWMAIMGELNSQRVSIYGLMGMNEHQKDVYLEVSKYAEMMHICVNETLQNPYEFNLYHYEEYQEAESKLSAEFKIYGRNPKQLSLFEEGVSNDG